MGPSPWRETLAERADLVSLLEALDPEQWRAATRCAGWTVFDLVAHLAAWDEVLLHGRGGAPVAFARWSVAMTSRRFDTDRFNDDGVQRARPLDPPALLRRFAAQVDRKNRWLFDRVAAGAQLAELVVHHDDIRDALGMRRSIPDDRLILALFGIQRLPGTPARARLKANRWVATDMDWSAGRGPVRERPARDILLELAGRHA